MNHPKFSDTAFEATLRRLLAEREQAPAGPSMTRRSLLQNGAKAMLATGLPLLGACGGGHGDDAPPPSAKVTRTFFFNHAHIAGADQDTHLRVGGGKHRLMPIATKRHVLERERRSNRFLAAVPDEHITHVLEDVPLDPLYSRPWFVPRFIGTDQVAIDGVYLLLPAGLAAERAFAHLQARAAAGQGTLRSRRRLRYGLPAAASPQDLSDEAALLDANSHAQALASWRMDTLSLDASSAYVVLGYAGDSDNVDDLAGKISTLGSAMPATTPGTTNAAGWATLDVLHDAKGQPVVHDDPGSPWNGRFVYVPRLHPTVGQLVAKAATADVLPAVQQDAGLGADITARPSGASLRGKLWVRSDGSATVAVPPAGLQAAAGQPTALAVNWVNSGSDLWFDFDSSFSVGADGVARVDFTFTNKALRYLGCFVEFLDINGNVLEIGSMPGYGDGSWLESPTGISDTNHPGDTRQFLGVIGPIGTVMGIPVYTDSSFYTSLEGRIKVSKDVAKIRVYAGGLGVGSTEHVELVGAGAAGTLLVNYALTVMFGALGAVGSLSSMQSRIIAIGNVVFNVLGAAIPDLLDGSTPGNKDFWKDQGISILNVLLAALTDPDNVFRPLGLLIAEQLAIEGAEAAVKEAIPLIGIAFMVESAIVTLADIALTSAQLFQSPLVYVAELSLTHELSVTLQADCNDTSLPKAANLLIATLSFAASQRTVTNTLALTSSDVDKSTLTFVIKPDAGQPPIPRGGKCSIAVQLLQRNTGVDVLLGTGATGWVDNVEPADFTIRITEREFPITATTRYRHVQRLYRDASATALPRVWQDAAAPALSESANGCGVSGQVCQYNDLIVRQGTSTSCGTGSITAIGYGWRSVDLGTTGDQEHFALVDADQPASAFVQTYAPAQGVAHLAFSRDPGGPNNYYVDNSSGRPFVRGLRLDASGGPAVDGAASNRAYGVLRYPSSALLVHPNGSLVSVCAGVDRLEMLRPAASAVDDATAARTYQSVILGISGNLPGQFSSVSGATFAPDGTLLVLEGGSNNRIQAFDLGMKPVRYFPARTVAGTPEYTLQLDDIAPGDGWVHLDVAAEMSGFIYVLSHNVKAGQAQYRVTLYNRNAAQLTAVTHVDGVYAMRIALDHWRTMYSLNLAPMTYVQTGQPNATEPSISRWVPCVC